ncbi:GNAT family N-acetyltransferase [Gluconacetobacter azotocaptans]|uniref:GNAT family N-acetyltransferase n=1 Tax=Gluconacetobacter azotocaptans TaxID=142834 RepID=UPI001957AD9B|nr:GNAT family N-acetyltransferase [Gluconacetobacter azotocaptans]MBM9401047.1 GNAT family N-acetyltransferase [Gluconacetobacter azotocaptans]
MNSISHDGNRIELRRSLTDSHIDQLVALFQGEWWTKGRIRSDVEKILQSGGPIFAFIEPGGDELVAFARILTDGVYKAMIFDIIVKSTWRNTGLGGLLMETVMNDSSIVNVTHRELYCLEEMVPFYEKWGFTSSLSGLHFMRKTS